MALGMTIGVLSKENAIVAIAVLRVASSDLGCETELLK